MSRAVSAVGELPSERGGPSAEAGGWDASRLSAALHGDVSELLVLQCGPCAPAPLLLRLSVERG